MRNGVAGGRVLKAVAKSWPGFIVGAVESRTRELVESGRFAEAAEVLEEAVDQYGSGTVPPVVLAWTLFRAERPADARRWALRAIEAEPEKADAHRVLGYALLDLGRRDEALAALRRGAELSPENGVHWMELAWVRHRERRFGAARELADRALESAPDNAWVRYTAGRIFERRLRYRRAQSHYERAIELDPADARKRYGLARVLRARGRISRSAACVYEAVPAPGAEREHEEVCAATMRSWAWRWPEAALRAALVLNTVDWVFPTPPRLGLPLAGLVLAAFALAWWRAFAALPAPCRRDLFAPAGWGHFAAASARTAVVLIAVAAVLAIELTSLQHLGVCAFIVLGYVDWHHRAEEPSETGLFH
ncbi:MAG TPA: tetratricopeptide repeat protein [Glycomyces sp.]|nr:tetratricopeptide repeat protein [Glycomyces sp.]